MEDIARGKRFAEMRRRLLRPMLMVAALAPLVVCCFGAGGDRTFKVSILPADAPMEQVQIEYLVDTAGMEAEPVQHSRGSSDFLIPVGKAKTLKALVYCPGYEFATIDLPSLAPSKYVASVTMKRARMIYFVGQILRYDAVAASDPVVRVEYLATWAMGALGYHVGPAPKFEVAVVPLLRDGTFSVEIPDFTQLPGDYSASDAELSFEVKSRKSGKVLLTLFPKGEEKRAFGLKMRANYARPTFFSAR